MSVKVTKTIYPLVMGAAAVLLLPAGASAVEFNISGQVNRLIMNVDNGEEDGLVHADNSVSGTRIRIAGSGDYRDGMTVGLLYETQLQSNPSSDITEDSLDSDGINGDVAAGFSEDGNHLVGETGPVAGGVKNHGQARQIRQIDLRPAGQRHIPRDRRLARRHSMGRL